MERGWIKIPNKVPSAIAKYFTAYLSLRTWKLVDLEVLSCLINKLSRPEREIGSEVFAVLCRQTIMETTLVATSTPSELVTNFPKRAGADSPVQFWSSFRRDHPLRWSKTVLTCPSPSTTFTSGKLSISNSQRNTWSSYFPGSLRVEVSTMDSPWLWGLHQSMRIRPNPLRITSEIVQPWTAADEIWAEFKEPTAIGFLLHHHLTLHSSFSSSTPLLHHFPPCDSPSHSRQQEPVGANKKKKKKISFSSKATYTELRVS